MEQLSLLFSKEEVKRSGDRAVRGIRVLGRAVKLKRQLEVKDIEKRAKKEKAITRKEVVRQIAKYEAESRTHKDEGRAVDAASAALILRYGELCMVEKREREERKAIKNRWQKREIELFETRHRLALFGAALEHESRGAAAVRRLHENEAQRQRCARAAAENVRRGFFAGGQAASLEVLDVYKIENRILLDNFLSLAHSNTNPPKKKVKGLFTLIPAASLERICVFGFAQETHKLLPRFFEDDWLARVSTNKKNQGGPAQRAATRFSAPQFPRPFSRYSTLHQLQDLAHHAQEDDESDHGLCAIRFLALSRVFVGNVQVSEQSSTASRKKEESYDNTNTTFDSIFDPKVEEYFPNFAHQVLPEFIIAFRFLPHNSQALPNDFFSFCDTTTTAAQQQAALVLAQHKKHIAAFDSTLTRTANFPIVDLLLTASIRTDDAAAPAQIDLSTLRRRLRNEKQCIINSLLHLFSHVLPAHDPYAKRIQDLIRANQDLDENYSSTTETTSSPFAAHDNDNNDDEEEASSSRLTTGEDDEASSAASSSAAMVYQTCSGALPLPRSPHGYARKQQERRHQNHQQTRALHRRQQKSSPPLSSPPTPPPSSRRRRQVRAAC